MTDVVHTQDFPMTVVLLSFRYNRLIIFFWLCFVTKKRETGIFNVFDILAGAEIVERCSFLSSARDAECAG